jgi:SAM-dependent methyltransferase
MTVVDLRDHKADYGFDGDYRAVSARTVATFVGATSAALLASAAHSLARGKPVAAAVAGGTGASIVTTAALFIRTTRVGKFEVWAEILDGLRLRGDETLLDLGCGRGAVLLAAAKLLPNGRAIGVDIWRADQTDNSQQNTLRNAELEGVADRVEVRTADITDLPFDDNSVDVIVSSLVVHNISDPAGARRRSARRHGFSGQAVASPSPTSGRPARTCNNYGISAGPTSVDAVSAGGCGAGMGTHLITATKPE